MTSREGVEKFQAAVGGGKVYAVRRRVGKQVWEWTACGKEEIKRVLELMLQNLLTVKRREAEIAVRWLEKLENRGRRGAYSEQEARQYEEVYWRLRELKQDAP